MKKIIIALLIFSICLLTVFFVANKNVSGEKAIEIGSDYCEKIIESFENATLNTDITAKNSDLIIKNINVLVESNENFINLDSYFSDIMLLNEEDNTSSEISEEDRIGLIIPEVETDDFVEESSIYIDDNGFKCIKVNDLRFISSGDALVNFYNGEYIINKEDIPYTFDKLKNEGYFDFILTGVNKVNNSEYEFNYCNYHSDYNTQLSITVIFDGNTVDNFIINVYEFNPFAK